MRRIIANRAKCRMCGDIIESKSDNDLVSCSCEMLTVDGGLNHLSRICRCHEDFIEMSETIPDAVFSAATSYFDTEEKALKWLCTPILALGNESPSQHIKKYSDGDRRVLDLIQSLKHGNTS